MENNRLIELQEMAGWDEDTVLGLLLDFISEEGLAGKLDKFLDARFAKEQETS